MMRLQKETKAKHQVETMGGGRQWWGGRQKNTAYTRGWRGHLGAIHQDRCV